MSGRTVDPGRAAYARSTRTTRTAAVPGTTCAVTGAPCQCMPHSCAPTKCALCRHWRRARLMPRSGYCAYPVPAWVPPGAYTDAALPLPRAAYCRAFKRRPRVK